MRGCSQARRRCRYEWGGIPTQLLKARASQNLDKPASAAFDPHLFQDFVAREKDPVRYSYKFIDLNLGGSTRDVNKELLNGITVTFYKRTLEKMTETLARSKTELQTREFLPARTRPGYAGRPSKRPRR